MDELIIDPAADIIGLIDVQQTFMPGGELAVADGDAVVPVINRLLSLFDHGFATQDWHPPQHQSFAGAHPGKSAYDQVEMPYGQQTLWPAHGLQNSANAAIHPDIDQSRIEVIIRKGFRPQIDSYSAFFENDQQTATGLDGYLTSRSIKRIFLTGLALDFCVAYSARDAARLGYQVFVIEDACRGIGLPIGPNVTTIDAAKKELRALGVGFVASANLARPNLPLRLDATVETYPE